MTWNNHSTGHSVCVYPGPVAQWQFPACESIAAMGGSQEQALLLLQGLHDMGWGWAVPGFGVHVPTAPHLRALFSDENQRAWCQGAPSAGGTVVEGERRSQRWGTGHCCNPLLPDSSSIFSTISSTPRHPVGEQGMGLREVQRLIPSSTKQEGVKMGAWGYGACFVLGGR